MQVSLCIKNNKGKEALRVFDNHIRLNSEPHLKLLSRPGRLVVQTDHMEEYLSKSAMDQITMFDPEFGNSNILLDLEVMQPGIVKGSGLLDSGGILPS